MENVNAKKNVTYVLKESAKILFGDLSANMLLLLGFILVFMGAGALSQISIANNAMPTMWDIWKSIYIGIALISSIVCVAGWLIMVKLNGIAYDMKTH